MKQSLIAIRTERLCAEIAAKDATIAELRLALEQVTLVAGNLSDSTLSSATGANDARYRGQMLCDARNIARAALEATPTPRPVLSKWQGWDQGRDGWAEDLHKNAVCAAVFGETWSMEDAHELISFIDRTWGSKP